MDYLSQNVEVSARRQRIKKASADNLAAVAYARILEDLTGTRHDIRQVEQHAPQGGVGLQNHREQKPVTTPNVNNPVKTGEIVPLDDPGARSRGRGCHCRIEDSGRFSILLQILKNPHPMQVIERRFTRAH
jgi:hypothetical protein